jgi:hypothetical protein
LHDALADAELAAGALSVRVAHGWVTLPGLRIVQKLMPQLASRRLRIDIGGLPEVNGGDVYECLVHGLALVRALVPDTRVESARRSETGAIEVELVAADRQWEVQLAVTAGRARLAVQADATAWSWQDGAETIVHNGQALLSQRPCAAGAARALAQLLGAATQGDSLLDAKTVMQLTRRAIGALAEPLGLGDRPFRQALSIARRRPSDVLARLGLRGALTGSTNAAPEVLTLPLPREPFELWAFRSGLKPVAFLTVPPPAVEATLAHFGDVAWVRRERQVQIGAQDRWTDRRDRGEPFVELYIAREPELAQRAARLQAEADPSAAVRQLGALVGYPPCCVEAFARQDDRSNNSRNRYFSFARTVAAGLTAAAVPWPWQLNNLHTMIAPFYPCGYRCADALQWADIALREMGQVYPELLQRLRLGLGRPALYFDHEHQISFAGTASDREIDYRSVALLQRGSESWEALVSIIAQGNHLSFDDRFLRVRRDGKVILQLERSDPGLGFIAPFGLRAD